MSKILFVINPVAGSRSHNKIVDQIRNVVKDVAVELHFEIWDSKEKYSVIKERILNESFDKVIAAGGDGTINLISKLVRGTSAMLGILPLGSGNGYARHLKIPLNVEKALMVILNNNTLNVDTASINEHYFINVAGIGFDGLVSEQFGKTKRRGMLNYISLMFRNFSSYKPKNYTIIYNEGMWTGKAVVLDFALGTQYGNNAVISPHSDPSDGKLDICIIKPFSFWYGFIILYRFYTRSIHKSKKYINFKTKRVHILNEELEVAHFDGEPLEVPAEFVVEISDHRLRVMVP